MSISWADSYVGQLRALAGDRTLMFVGARAVVRDSAGRVLLIRRSDNGQWAMPAGAMELGESIADCAVREVREETGLRALRVGAFALYTGPDRITTNMYGHTYQVFTVAFRVEDWDGELVRATDETTDAGFFHRDRFPAPLSASVTETLADLDVFEQANRMILK
ncbi:ADP-ribose pyrophosphatase YjhB, NUDIX family [Micromonospora haikouensis]|uniref:ADP-ribose pyrophosphatase YjhB, NUDIX family n=1 Tax=Micromonospora haikouensis TaxID=686309 RepID=A0A1C4X2U3_9ACTN|nr:NUDIX domain-containing protein [Micromonospora haikouensis]SCF02451.1 ADP-ribose pyrophosphatase YjhB, NUDIX family [Micromonospora haikouensis]